MKFTSCLTFRGLLVGINELHPNIFKDTVSRKGICPQALFTLIIHTQFTPRYVSTEQFPVVFCGLPKCELDEF